MYITHHADIHRCFCSSWDFKTCEISNNQRQKRSKRLSLNICFVFNAFLSGRRTSAQEDTAKLGNKNQKRKYMRKKTRHLHQNEHFGCRRHLFVAKPIKTMDLLHE